MRSIIRTYVATALLGSTLVSAVPQRLDLRSFERLVDKRAPLDPAISVSSGSAPPATPELTPTSSSDSVSPVVSAYSAPSTAPSATPVPNVDTTTLDQIYDTDTALPATFTASIHTTSGSLPNPADSAYSTTPTFVLASVSSTHSSLASQPTVVSSDPLSGHGVLTGIVVGCLVFGFLVLTLGLWLCYRRRGPTSGPSTPIYITKVVSDEKPRSAFAFLRYAPLQWKKVRHHRVRSSLSFESPVIENEPQMMEKEYPRTPPASHHGGGSARDTARWSTFSTSDGSAYPQTPVGTTRLSGIIMETVVETDALSNPRTPITGARDYTELRRSTTNEAILNRTPKLISQLPPLGTNRLSMFREEQTTTPSTPTSSGGQTFGSAGHGSGHSYARTIDRSSQQQPLPPPIMTTQSNSSGSLRGGSALVNARPKFNPAHNNGSGSVSTDHESDGTIRITNPFLDEEDALSSYGHGMVEADDSRSIQTVESDAYGAYPSSNGCLPKQPGVGGPGPTGPDGQLPRPRSSLISDASSDYPYPLGYAMDLDGNVANPFLRISEILEEVDGRMRWPSPPLLPRAESRTY